MRADSPESLAFQKSRKEFLRQVLGFLRAVSLSPHVSVERIPIDAAELLQGLGGDDSLTVNINGPTSNVISVPIEYNGGDGFDTLTVLGNPTTAVDEVIYTPGSTADRGALRYEDAANARLMSIGFQNLEPALFVAFAAVSWPS